MATFLEGESLSLCTFSVTSPMPCYIYTTSYIPHIISTFTSFCNSISFEIRLGCSCYRVYLEVCLPKNLFIEMGLGTCGIYVSFGKKRSVVGHEHLSPKPQKFVSDVFESSSSSDSTILWSSKSPNDRNLVTEKEFRHQRSFSQCNIYKPPRNYLIPGRSSDANQADRNLVTEKKFSHQRSFSQGNCYEPPQNNLVPRRASDANQAAEQGLGSGRCHYYGHGNIIKGLNSITRPKNPASVEELNNLGNMKYRKGYFKEAIPLYDKAIALSPQNAAFHTNKAAALISLGKLTEAVEECLKAIKCDPSCSRAHYMLGTLCTRYCL